MNHSKRALSYALIMNAMRFSLIWPLFSHIVYALNPHLNHILLFLPIGNSESCIVDSAYKSIQVNQLAVVAQSNGSFCISRVRCKLFPLFSSLYPIMAYNGSCVSPFTKPIMAVKIAIMYGRYLAIYEESHQLLSHYFKDNFNLLVSLSNI